VRDIIDFFSERTRQQKRIKEKKRDSRGRKRERKKESGRERGKERVPCERTQTPKDMYVYRHVFIIYTRVNVSFRPMLALRTCPLQHTATHSFPTFPYCFVLLFFLLLLFLFLSRKLACTGKSPMLHCLFSSSSPWRRKDTVEVISVSVHLSQMPSAAVRVTAGGYRKPLPTCSSCMTPHTLGIMLLRDGTAFLLSCLHGTHKSAQSA